MMQFKIIILILLSVAKLNQCLIDMMKINETICEKLITKPYFDIDMVLGEPWRILYTWNMSLDQKCVDMLFENATPKMISEIWNDMHEYLEDQPIWAGATLHMSMGPTRYELLMFAKPGSAGAFTAVPNIIKKPGLPPPRHSVPLLMFHITLMENGKFLVMVDCQIGVGSLSSRISSAPSKEEVLSLVSTLDLGDGHPACTGHEKEFLQHLLD